MAAWMSMSPHELLGERRRRAPHIPLRIFGSREGRALGHKATLATAQAQGRICECSQGHTRSSRSSLLAAISSYSQLHLKPRPGPVLKCRSRADTVKRTHPWAFGRVECFLAFPFCRAPPYMYRVTKSGCRLLMALQMSRKTCGEQAASVFRESKDV